MSMFKYHQVGRNSCAIFRLVRCLRTAFALRRWYHHVFGQTEKHAPPAPTSLSVGQGGSFQPCCSCCLGQSRSYGSLRSPVGVDWAGCHFRSVSRVLCDFADAAGWRQEMEPAALADPASVHGYRYCSCCLDDRTSIERALTKPQQRLGERRLCYDQAGNYRDHGLPAYVGDCLWLRCPLGRIDRPCNIR